MTHVVPCTPVSADEDCCLAVVNVDPKNPAASALAGTVSVADSSGEELRNGCCSGGLVVVCGTVRGCTWVFKASPPGKHGAPQLRFLRKISPMGAELSPLYEPRAAAAIPRGSAADFAAVLACVGGVALLGESGDVQQRVSSPDSQPSVGDVAVPQRKDATVAVVSEWAAPEHWQQGFKSSSLADGGFGSRLWIWSIVPGAAGLVDTLDFGGVAEGRGSLSVALFGETPEPMPQVASGAGYCACVCDGSVHYFYPQKSGKWRQQKAIQSPGRSSDIGRVPCFLSRIALSGDSRFLFVSHWLHGEVRQYSVAPDPSSPILVGMVKCGGLTPSILKQPTNGGDADMGGSGPGGLCGVGDSGVLVSTSFLRTWDAQWYPPHNDDAKQEGGLLFLRTDGSSGGCLSSSVPLRCLTRAGSSPVLPAAAMELG
eukprot:Hpha_TRINITY_DN4812_c0_g1::TRINITY_DN4812_c0_g1_i1::g.20205::m.20205/K17285/SELENBP1; selenium-binding protein 1